MSTITPTLRMNDLCYYDGMIGLVPCKLIGAERDSRGYVTVRLKVTAKRGPYDRGSIIETVTRYAIPRSAVYVRGGQYRIRPHVILFDGFFK